MCLQPANYLRCEVSTLTTGRVEPDATIAGRVLEILRDVWVAGGRDERALDGLSLNTVLFDVRGTGTATLPLDSLDALEIGLQLEESFGVPVPDDVDVEDLLTPGRLALLVARLRGTE
jgi:hypothetical protein